MTRRAIIWRPHATGAATITPTIEPREQPHAIAVAGDGTKQAFVERAVRGR